VPFLDTTGRDDVAVLPTTDGVPSDPEPLAAEVQRRPLTFVLARLRAPACAAAREAR
jgi:hypothetical protein